MGVAALTGYENVNGRAMDLWEQVYGKSLLIALTDTFSTKAFFMACAVVDRRPGDIADLH